MDGFLRLSAKSKPGLLSADFLSAAGAYLRFGTGAALGVLLPKPITHHSKKVKNSKQMITYVYIRYRKNDVPFLVINKTQQMKKKRLTSPIKTELKRSGTIMLINPVIILTILLFIQNKLHPYKDFPR